MYYKPGKSVINSSIRGIGQYALYKFTIYLLTSLLTSTGITTCMLLSHFVIGYITAGKVANFQLGSINTAELSISGYYVFSKLICLMSVLADDKLGLRYSYSSHVVLI